MTFDLELSFVEIYDEIIQDLLNSQKRDLPLREDPVHGMRVQGVTVAGPMMNAAGVLEVYRAGIDARSREGTDYGPADMYASTVLQLRLKQTIRGARSKVGELISTLTIADIAGAEKAAAPDSVALRAAEGPRLNKAAFAFMACADAMKAGKEADYVPHADSKLTLLLKENLGGNSLTTVVTVVQQNETLVTETTLRAASGLRSGVTFPVIMEVTTRGLIRRLRIQAKQLRDELSELRYGAASADARVKDGEADLLLRVTELEGRAIRDNLEKLKVQDEKNKLQERFRDFRDKYNALVDSKAAAQEALIEAEEEKLRISKALLDMQIRNNQLQESVDKEKFELSAKLMSAENDLVELEMRRQQAVEKMEEFKRAFEDLSTEKREMSMELVTLKSNLVARTRELRAERAKNEDLGTEILTLVNQKAVLEAAAKTAEHDKDEHAKKSHTLQEQVDSMRADYQLVKQKLRETLDTLDEANAARVKAELAAERAKVDFASKKLEVERNMAEYTQGVDAEVAKAREGGARETEESIRMREEAQRTIASLEATIKAQQRKISDLRAEVAERSTESGNLGNKIAKLEATLAREMDEFRERLLKHLSDDKDSTRQAVIDDLVGTYRQREAENSEEIDELRRENHELVRRLRAVKGKAKDAHYRVADLTDDTAEAAEMENAAKVLDLEDGEASSLEAKLSKELEAARAAQAAAQREAAVAKEKTLTTAEELRKQVTELQQQVSDLTAENERLKASAGGDASAEQMEEMREKLMKQMQEAGAAGGAASALQEDLDVANEKIKELEEELESTKAALEEAQKAEAAPAPRSRRGSITGLPQSARTPIPVQEDAEPGSVLEQLRLSEQKAVQLLSRNTVLEKEAENYAAYMKTTIMKYKKEIARLKKEVAMWKAKAGG